MARVRTENGDTFEIAEATVDGSQSGVHLEVKGSELGIETRAAYLLTSAEARRIGMALTTLANQIDAKNA